MFLYFLRYLRFIFISGNAHSIHSPFVYNLYTCVIAVRKRYYVFQHLERLRAAMLQDYSKLIIHDLGAGSKRSLDKQRSVAAITKVSQKSQHQAELLFRLILFFKPATILDLGTSLGLTTLYMASALKATKIYTFEGCPNIAAKAKEHFKQLGYYPSITQVTGNLDQTLEQFLEDLPAADFVFFDANHRYQPTLRYFQLCLEKAHEHSIFIFDDIHWSAEMQQAWTAICGHPAVMLTIDLFSMGMVFFRKGQPKQHFCLRL